jgi:hypothetical protein
MSAGSQGDERKLHPKVDVYSSPVSPFFEGREGFLELETVSFTVLCKQLLDTLTNQ